MNPLSKRVRTISSIVTLVLFIIIGPLIVAYSFGYRFDDLEENFNWIKTGGIYIHSNLANSEIYLDGEFVKKTGLLMRNTFIQNLRVDKNHVVEIKKKDYHSYRKELQVDESWVTETRVLMLPKEIESVAILPYVDIGGIGTTTDSSATAINDQYRNLLVAFDLASSTESLTDTISSNLNIFQSEGQVFEKELQDFQDATNTSATTTATSTLDIPGFFTDLGVVDPTKLENLIINNDEVSWLEDGDVIINWIGKEDQTPFYYCNFEECRKEIIVNWDSGIKSFAFLPNRNDVLVVLDDVGLWAVEVDDRSVRNIQPIYLEEDLDFRINSSNRIVVLDEDIFYELRF